MILMDVLSFRQDYYSSQMCNKIYEFLVNKINGIIDEIKQYNKLSFTAGFWTDISDGCQHWAWPYMLSTRSWKNKSCIRCCSFWRSTHWRLPIKYIWQKCWKNGVLEEQPFIVLMSYSEANIKNTLFPSDQNNLDFIVKIQLTIKSEQSYKRKWATSQLSYYYHLTMTDG